MNRQLTRAREAAPEAWGRDREKPGLSDSRGISHAAYHLTPGMNKSRKEVRAELTVLETKNRMWRS